METSDENNQLEASIMSDGLVWWKRRRLLVCFMMFLGFFIGHCSQVNMSIAIVPIMDPVKAENGTILQPAEFDWDVELRVHLLSAFFYGYFITQLLGGWLGARFGGVTMMALSIGLPAAISLLTPGAALIGPGAMIAIRMIMGIVSGPLYPSCHAVWSEWAPPLERTSLVSYTFTGGNFGNVIILLIGGILATRLGWPSLFYFPGGAGLLWVVIWLFLIRRRPDLDKHINPKELKYIQEKLQEESVMQNTSHPWKEILTSVPVWVNVITLFCSQWGFNTLLTMLPTYMRDNLKFDLDMIGYMSAIPFVALTILLPVSGSLADFIIARKFLSVTLVRKLWVCVSLTIQSVFLLISLAIEDKGGLVACLSFAFGFNTVSFGSLMVNALDLGRQHASVIIGISNTFGNLSGICSSVFAGYMITLSSGWMIVFFVICGVSIVAILAFGFFGSGVQQPWATEEKN